MGGQDGNRIVIRALPQVGEAAAVRRRLLEIFHLARGDGEFASPAERQAFERRWLTTYLDRFPQACLLAMRQPGPHAPSPTRAAGDDIVGYLAGMLHPPRGDTVLEEQGYHHLFAAVTERAPAHLHINVAPDWRSHGIGGQLVGAFLDLVRAEGVAGVHVVTAEKSRNVGFYRRAGFADAATALLEGKSLLCLVRTVI